MSADARRALRAVVRRGGELSEQQGDALADLLVVVDCWRDVASEVALKRIQAAYIALLELTLPGSFGPTCSPSSPSFGPTSTNWPPGSDVSPEQDLPLVLASLSQPRVGPNPAEQVGPGLGGKDKRPCPLTSRIWTPCAVRIRDSRKSLRYPVGRWCDRRGGPHCL